MLHTTHVLEPPTDPGRFIRGFGRLVYSRLETAKFVLKNEKVEPKVQSLPAQLRFLLAWEVGEKARSGRLG